MIVGSFYSVDNFDKYDQGGIKQVTSLSNFEKESFIQALTATRAPYFILLCEGYRRMSNA